jgi:hypothetical protein
MSPESGPFQRLRDRVKTTWRRLPKIETAALIKILVLALVDQRITGAEWEAIEDAYGHLRSAMGRAAEIEERDE